MQKCYLIKNYLILGSNQKLKLVIFELYSYVLVESNLIVVPFNEDDVSNTIDFFANHADEVIRNNFHFINNYSFKIGFLNVTFTTGDIVNKPFLIDITKNIDSIIVLCNSQELEMEAADSITLVTLIHLRDIAAQHNRNYSIVVELLNKANEELAINNQVSDFIIGSIMTSSILAQLSEEKDLEDVFNILFTSDGSELYFRKLFDYANVSQNRLTFAEIIDIFSVYNETAIGYMYLNGENEYKINPDKNSIVPITENLKIIVLAED